MSLSKEELDLVDNAPMDEMENEIAQNMNWFLDRIFGWPSGRMKMRVKMIGHEVNGIQRAFALKYDASPPLSDAELLAASDAILRMTEELSTLGKALENKGLDMAVDFSPKGTNEVGGGEAAKLTISAPRGMDREKVSEIVKNLGVKAAERITDPIINKKDLN